MNLPINEIFSSIQGEGTHTGTPAIFVRLQYCPVGCPWCDTKHTWEKVDKNKISFDEMMLKTEDAPTWADTNVEELMSYIASQPEELIVITGGEPCTYNLMELTTAILIEGRLPQIETSGTASIDVAEGTFVTLSPKIDMPGGKRVLTTAWHRADEIKMPVGKMSDIQTLKDVLHDNINNAPVYVQPLSQSPKATELCIAQARLNGWRLSAQLHKYLKVR